MADVRAFRGIHYNEDLLEDVSSVICPPYDIISPEEQEALYSQSEYNFVRLEYNRKLPQDTPTDNGYTRAAATLEKWLQDGILVADEKPSLYIHDHSFTFRGKRLRRRGIVAQIRLEEWDKMIVRPHEGTLTGPRGDRLSLLWALQANTSPILAMYEDRGGHVADILKAHDMNEPFVHYQRGGEGHTVRAVDDPEEIIQIMNCFSGQPIYIADGHHRYESALAYQQERHGSMSSASFNDPFNFVMMTLVDFKDPGLLILPPHRLVRGISKTSLAELRDKLQAFFKVETLPFVEPDVWQQIEAVAQVKNGITLQLYGLDENNLMILNLRDPDTVIHMMPYFHTPLYRNLDVSIVDHVILEHLLALTQEKEATSLAYSYDRHDAIARVQSQEFQLALLVSPISPELIKTVADAKDKMPRKSTYFYPKSPSGLVFNRLV